MTAPVDDDAQRALEQHALRNVHSLAEKLGYRDLMDRRAEKKTLVGIGLAVTALVALLAIMMVMKSPPAHHEERKRCETEIVIREGARMREELKAHRPELGAADVVRQVEGHMRDVAKGAAQECAERYSTK